MILITYYKLSHISNFHVDGQNRTYSSSGLASTKHIAQFADFTSCHLMQHHWHKLKNPSQVRRREMLFVLCEGIVSNCKQVHENMPI